MCIFLLFFVRQPLCFKAFSIKGGMLRQIQIQKTHAVIDRCHQLIIWLAVQHEHIRCLYGRCGHRVGLVITVLHTCVQVCLLGFLFSVWKESLSFSIPSLSKSCPVQTDRHRCSLTLSACLDVGVGYCAVPGVVGTNDRKSYFRGLTKAGRQREHGLDMFQKWVWYLPLKLN